MRGTDGVKIAVLRGGLTGLKFMWAAAHARRSTKHKR